MQDAAESRLRKLFFPTSGGAAGAAAESLLLSPDAAATCSHCSNVLHEREKQYAVGLCNACYDACEKVHCTHSHSLGLEHRCLHMLPRSKWHSLPVVLAGLPLVQGTAGAQATPLALWAVRRMLSCVRKEVPLVPEGASARRAALGFGALQLVLRGGEVVPNLPRQDRAEAAPLGLGAV